MLAYRCASPRPLRFPIHTPGDPFGTHAPLVDHAVPGMCAVCSRWFAAQSDTIAEAELLGVDQLGFDLRAKLNAAAPSTVMRIGFRMPPANEEEGISVFMKLFQEAYEREHGFMQ